MDIFNGSMEDKCGKCNEPLLIFSEDVIHRNKKGALCSVCAKNEECQEYSVIHVINIKPNSEVNCQDCSNKITKITDMVIYQEEPPFILCTDCDHKRQILNY
jgi:hypothetical protein